MSRKPQRILAAGASLLALAAGAAQADQVFNDDVIATFSLCVGNDCVNGESFGFDTIRLKENNTRIKFQDTSNSASFPTNDWQLTANSSDNGGGNYFSIDDVDGSSTPFLVEAGAGNNAVYVKSTGYVGFGTSSPVVDLHVKQGNSPALRLEQDGSSGFTSQTWDIAGNETNFFIRDVTNGSELPFKIRPGADDNSIYIDTDSDVGMATSSPDAQLHVVGGTAAALLVDATDGGASSAFAHFRTSDGTSSTPALLVEDTAATAGIRRLMELRNNGGVSLVFQNTNSNVRWAMVNENAASDSSFLINDADSNGNSAELTLDRAGNLSILGSFYAGGTQLNVPDYVFEENYVLMPLQDVKAFIQENGHLPKIPSAGEIAQSGLNMTEMQMALLEKIEELTLYTLGQEDMIAQLENRLAELGG
ncbi:hypothetical protein KUW17_19900 [Leisingera aquaemixtae]|uniref:hypothetical protein n=1 Tax=Leisingera aquaemixtae TaxID=1396826 RepID=UPI001C9676BE|nr:hypothetical protein [Leisingera aquaemixtae]MBY6069016.1 hypothetical protein [Leisingera aquaemixtae]